MCRSIWQMMTSWNRIIREVALKTYSTFAKTVKQYKLYLPPARQWKSYSNFTLVRLDQCNHIKADIFQACVMNIITSHRALALYPWSTFVTRESLIVETANTHQDAGRQKYIDRGWTMIPTSSMSSKSELGVRVGRSLGDRFTWTMPLDPVNADMEDIDFFYHSTSWSLEYDGAITQIHVDT